MMTRILVPLDGSRHAEQALAGAIRLGQGFPAELVLLRAVSVPPSARQDLDKAGPGANGELEALETRAKDYLQGMADSLRGIIPHVRYVIRCGPAAEAIVEYAQQANIQQIVMATHRYGGLRCWRDGSVAERVIQAASIPVLLVRGGERNLRDAREPISCRRILVPLDGSKRAEQVLPPITATAQALGCEVILFHVSGSFLFESSSQAAERIAKAYLARVASRPREQGIAVSVATGRGPVAESIVLFAENNNVDLIAMPTHGRTGVARWVLGSVAGQVYRAGSTPILLVRATRQLSRH
jgi:nucleotide-binding universal stress UspA family protein